jgi:hypothetical protein
MALSIRPAALMTKCGKSHEWITGTKTRIFAPVKSFLAPTVVITAASSLLGDGWGVAPGLRRGAGMRWVPPHARPLSWSDSEVSWKVPAGSARVRA